MTDSIAIELSRLREEIHAGRMEQLRGLHALDVRMHRLEQQDRQGVIAREELRGRISKRFKALEQRVAVFEGHKRSAAWLGWSVAAALLSVSFPIGASVLAKLF